MVFGDLLFFRGPVRMPSSPCLAIPFWAIHTQGHLTPRGLWLPPWVTPTPDRAPSIVLWHQAWSLTVVWTPFLLSVLGLGTPAPTDAPMPGSSSPHVDILPALGFDSPHQAAYPPHPITTLPSALSSLALTPYPHQAPLYRPLPPCGPSSGLRLNAQEKGRTYAHDTPPRKRRKAGWWWKQASKRAGGYLKQLTRWDVQIRTLSCSGWRGVEPRSSPALGLPSRHLAKTPGDLQTLALNQVSWHLYVAQDNPRGFQFLFNDDWKIVKLCSGLKLKFQYFGHSLMQRADSLKKTLMLEKIEGGRRRGRQRIKWSDGITDLMDMSLRKLR